MSTLYITTAGGKDEDEDGEESLEGALFEMATETSGREEFQSRVMLG